MNNNMLKQMARYWRVSPSDAERLMKAVFEARNRRTSVDTIEAQLRELNKPKPVMSKPVSNKEETKEE